MDPSTSTTMKNPRKRKGRREKVKVVYIASPVKFKTCASRFRALVQELTGRDSDVSRYMDDNNVDHNSQEMILDRGFSSVNDRVSDSSTSSESCFDPTVDDLLINSHVQGGFLETFNSSNLFDQDFEFGGVFGGYGAG